MMRFLLPSALCVSMAHAQAPLAEVSLPVATRRLPRGTVLSESDMRVARVVGRPPRALASPGWITQRVIAPGEVLQAPALAPAPLIKQGDMVHYIVLQNGIELDVLGKAERSANRGDEVAVRLGANRRLRGIAAEPGRVNALSKETPK